MRILYIRHAGHVEPDLTCDPALLATSKKIIQSSHLKKFCLFRIAKEELVIVFDNMWNHSDMASRLLKRLGLPTEAFLGAGRVEQGGIIFDSMTCMKQFGYDTPQEEGMDKFIAEALEKDGFFTEE